MGRETAIGLIGLCLLGATAVHSAAASSETVVLSLPTATEMALARDVLVREAQQSLEDARAALVRERATTPRLSVDSSSSAASSAGLDPESAVSGTDYSSQSYSSVISVPLRGGTHVSLSTAASTSTTNSQLRAGGGMEYTYAAAAAGLGFSRPLPLLRDERVLTEGGRWSAEISVKRAELALEEVRRRVVGDTLALFFAALQAQRQAELAQAALRETEELLRIAQEKFQRGKVAEVEVMETQVSASSVSVSLRRAGSAAATTLDGLKNLLGVPLEQPVEISYEEAFALSPMSLDEAVLTERALYRRPDLQQLALGVQQAELSARQAEAQARPGIFLTANYSRSGQAATISESFHQLINPSWFVGLSATTNVTRAEDRAAIQQARGQLRLTQLEEQLRRDEVRLEIRRLMREVRDAGANALQLGETVRMAEENLRIRQTQFDHGLVRPIDVMETERRLSETRNQHLNALIDYQLARARLNLAVGEMPVVAQPEPESHGADGGGERDEGA